VVAAAPALDAVPTSPAKQQQMAGAFAPSKAVVAAAASSSPAPPPPPCSSSSPAPAATPAAERDAQKSYWEQHSKVPTVEAMMLDSKAAEIDRMERPEVRTRGWCCRREGERRTRLLSLLHARDWPTAPGKPPVLGPRPPRSPPPSGRPFRSRAGARQHQKQKNAAAVVAAAALSPPRAQPTTTPKTKRT
jgi:hypothetical protein